jgi:hypothetical protein
MNDYDGIKNLNNLKCSPFEKFDNLWFIIFYGDQNIEWKKTIVKTRFFLSCVVHIKGFWSTKVQKFIWVWSQANEPMVMKDSKIIVFFMVIFIFS